MMKRLTSGISPKELLKIVRRETESGALKEPLCLISLHTFACNSIYDMQEELPKHLAYLEFKSC